MDWHGLIRRLVIKTFPKRALVQLKKMYYRRYLESLARNEPDLAVVKHLVSAADCVLDIGANVGTYTLALARMVGPQGCVLSFEPIAETFAILSSNVSGYHLDNVKLVEVALSSSDGPVAMEIPNWSNGGKNYYQSRIVAPDATSGSAHRVVAESRRLDTFFADLQQKRITFVKIDVEGHELEVLRGGEKVLRQHQPAMLLEASGNPDDIGGTVANLFALLANMGYSPYWYDGKELRARRAGDRSTNYFFLTVTQLDEFHRNIARG